MKKKWDAIWTNGLIASCESGYGLVADAAIAIKNGKIAWIGRLKDLKTSPDKLAALVYDVGGRCITPGFIDCHTHLVYAGNRAREFELRIQGATYTEIAQSGGGIQSTVSATRATSARDLLNQSLIRARNLMASGVTTIEIKSGYGLDWESEFKLLRIAQRIGDYLPVTVYKTFLGAHSVPVEFREQPDAYVDMICNEMIPIVAQGKLADAVDVFCENMAFNLQQTERIFKAAQKYGLAIKCHAEQLSSMGSAQLAAKYHAVSVDHLEHISLAGIKAIAQSGTVAVLLPGAFYFLRETSLPPIESLREQHVPIAIASDCNPGTSPISSLLIILNMACTLFRLTPEEALAGVTRHAAKAIGLEKTHGTLSVGKVADFAIWDVSHPNELTYYLGRNLLWQLIKSGNVL